MLICLRMMRCRILMGKRSLAFGEYGETVFSLYFLVWF